MQHRVAKETPPYPLSYPLGYSDRTSARPWVRTRGEVPNEVALSTPIQADLPRSERPTSCNNTCIKTRTEKKQWLWSLVIAPCVEWKHLFADQTLFSEKFAVSLGPRLGVSPQD